MERGRSWLGSLAKSSFLLRAKDVLAHVALNLRHRAKEKSEGLVGLYKDMEACGGYGDIQVMWEMVHSSSPSGDVQNNRNRSRRKFWKFCFHQV